MASPTMPANQDVPARPSEKVPLLKPLNKPWQEDGDGHRSNSWTVFFGFLKHTLLHTLLFMVASIAFMTGYHAIPKTLAFLVVLLVIACLSDAFYAYHVRRRINKETLAFTVAAFALLSGGVVGTALDMTHLVDYWPYNLRRHYTNVAPDELAASHADASVLVFMKGARPDPSRSMGYFRHGHTYCVAPIALESGYSDQQLSADVQYWAVGKDCCKGEHAFNCDDATDPNARAGLVKIDKSHSDSDSETFMEGVMSSSEMNYYEKAVLMTMAKFDLQSPKERLYVRFVADIEKSRSGYWSDAWFAWGKYQALWLLVWIVAGALIVVIGAGDDSDTNRYQDHFNDVLQGTFSKLNQWI